MKTNLRGILTSARFAAPVLGVLLLSETAQAQAIAGPTDLSGDHASPQTSQQGAAGVSDNAQGGPPTLAGDSSGIAEIIVTAERRSSSLQRTPAAISVRNGAELQQQGKFTVRQVLEDVPSVSTADFRGQVNSGSDTAGNNVTIRGVGSNEAPGTVSSVPTSAVYTDGVYEGVGSDFDVDRVEVLRGPQGTLYGRSATAGVLSFHTRDPLPGEWHGDATGEVGNYDLRHYTGALNVPIGKNVAIRVSGDQYARDGYYNGNGGHFNRTQGRIKVLFQPTEDLRLLVGVAVQDNKTNTGGARGVITPDGRNSYSSFLPIYTSHNRFWQYWGDFSLDLGAVTINYLPAYRTWDQNAVQSAIGPGLLALRQVVKTPKDYFHTQELRFSGDITDRFNWLAGAFYYDNDVSNSNDIRWAQSGGLAAFSDTRRRTRNLGFYADGTFDVTSTTRLTGGIRWDYTKVQTEQLYISNAFFFCGTPIAPLLPNGSPAIPGCLPGNGTTAGLPENNVSASVSGPAGTKVFRNVTFRARLEHDLSPRNLVYAVVSSGFVPGDVQFSTGRGPTGLQVPVVRNYDAETLTAYEIGSKNRFFNDVLQLNGDVFFYDYGGFQKLINPNQVDPTAQFLVTVPARVWGAELEGVIRPTPVDRLTFNYAYLGSRYHGRTTEFLTAVSQSFLTGVTPHTVNVSYDHSVRFGETALLLRAAVRYLSARDRIDVSPQYNAQFAVAGIDRDALIRQDGEFVADASATLTLPGHTVSITAYVRNLFDNRYVNGLQLQQVLPVFLATGTNYDPRTYGVVATVRF